jgi:DNA polymerase-3 subunit delta'
MPFADVIGQDRAVEILSRELSHDRISHAYLFSGMEGVGKKYTALALAMAVLCSRKESDACGECPACRKVLAGTHPDLRCYDPMARTKGAPAKIYIEQIRTLQQEVALCPMEGGKKVFIIDEADRMVLQAANALLKTLEEPPGDSLLILVTAYPDLLPRTILSRCRVVHFGPLSGQAVEQILTQCRGLAREEAARLARYAQGRVDRVMEMGEGEVLSRRDRFLGWMQGWNLKEIGSIFEVSERFNGKADEAIEFVEFLLSWTRDLISVKLREERGMLIHADRAAELTEESGKHGMAELLRQADALEETLGRLRMNINPRLALETALIRMADTKAL